MCLYPKLIDNKRYKPTKKNNYNPPPAPADQRLLYVAVGCTRCIECRKQKARNWSVRLQEEIRNDQSGKFVTLSFSNEKLNEIHNKLKTNATGYQLDNEIATYAIRHFLELWRKHHKKSVKHWLTTELGQTNTERIHIHGIIFTDESAEISKIWKYGNVFIGKTCNEKTINYIVKYLHKGDQQHKEYIPKLHTSAGIGANYIKRTDSNLNKYKTDQTKETYTTRQGIKLALPIYYRNKIYSEEERELLWLEKLNKNERYILGQKIDISTEEGEQNYVNVLKEAQQLNSRLGYGNDIKNWESIKYEHKRRKLKQKEYIKTLK